MDAAVFTGCRPQCYELFKGCEPLDSSFLQNLTTQLQPQGSKWERGGAGGYLDIVGWQHMAALSNLMGPAQAGRPVAPSFLFSFFTQAEWVNQKSPGPAPASTYLYVRPNLHVTAHTHTAKRKYRLSSLQTLMNGSCRGHSKQTPLYTGI